MNIMIKGFLVLNLILSMLLCSCGSESSDPVPNVPEPDDVYIYAVVVTPTDQESITLKNNSGVTQDISGWKLGDKNDPTAYSIPGGTVLMDGQTIKFSHTTLGFGINDSGEIIYLKNSIGTTIDSWSN